MRALTITGPQRAAVLNVEPPIAAPGEALVAPRYVGLCGTDAELFAGTMPYFNQGEASFPLQPGHEVTGTVVTSPPGGPPPGTAVVIDPVVGCGACPACAEGRPTWCADRREMGVRRGMPGGACELIAVPAQNLHPVPAGVSCREAVLVEPGVTALNAVRRLGEVEGRRALVIGAGTLGLLASQLLTSRGGEVDVVTIEPSRRGLVERLGLRPIEKADPASYHLVVEAAGQPAAARSAIAAVATGGQVALTGVQPAPIDDFELNELVLKDATAFGVLNGPGLYDLMLAEIASGAVDAGALIEAEFELASAPAALTYRSGAAPKVLLRIDRPTP